MTGYIKKIPNAVKFLMAVIVLYVFAYLAHPEYAVSAFENFLATLYQVFPILLLVFFVMFLSFIFIKPETVKRHLGHDSGLKGWFYATLGSIVISGPPYVLFPLLGELKKHGMKYSLIAVFMNNRNVQPTFLPVMAYYFGWQFSIVFAGYVLAFSLLSGLIIGRLMREKNLLL
jgi:uncharacterized membrane protein YraQ (UPF0718 family)